MRLIEWQARHWRGLEEQRIGPLSPHLNLVTGPNESGKSRMVQALWYGLFETSKGQAQYKQELQSWQDPGSSPFTRIRFALGQVEYELEKRFLKGAYTRLSGGGQTLEGDAAEERLRTLLRTRPGKRTGVADEDLGLWPLLWLRQGDSRVPPHVHMNEDSRGWLQDSLSAQIGEATVGPKGQALLQRARAEFERYFTPTGQEGKVLRETREALEQAREAWERARDHQDATLQAAGKLQRLQDELDGLVPRIRRQQDVLAEARGKAEDARNARQQLAVLEEQVKWQAGELEQAVQRCKDRDRLQGELEQIREARRAAEVDQEHLQQDVTRLTAELEACKAAVAEADKARQQARDILEKVRRADQQRLLREERERLAGNLDEARMLREQCTDIDRQLRQCGGITEAQVQAYRRVSEALEQARARLEGAAAAVELLALDDVHIDGEMLPKGGRRRFPVTEDRVIRIGDLVAVAISPGGGELARLRDRVADTQREVDAAGAELGVSTVAEAEERLTRRAELMRELRLLEQRLQDRAPDGIEALERHQRLLDEQLQAREAAQEALPDVVAAERSEREAEHRLQRVRDDRDRLQQVLAERNAALAGQRMTVRGLAQQQERLQRALDQFPGAAELAAAQASARSAWEERVVSRDQARARFEELGGDQAAMDLQQAHQALSGLESRQQELEQQIRELRWTLQRAAEDAPYESLLEQEAVLEAAERQDQRLRRQAEAARRLWTLLSERRRAAQERLTRPVMERIGPYLEDIFPGSSLALDEELRVAGLESGPIRESYEALSGGAQEQLGMLVRIGLAEVLAGEESLPLVLDDALINTDADRIRQVQRLLYRASRERLQIILFTCHGALFDALGADAAFALQGARAPL
ncbi:MAG: hypothetical protein JJT90_05425 [Ectothiorhodospiraceae bacterium]|nr:hypothetical protein [Ectothiorhodospiraceae bacterium]